MNNIINTINDEIDRIVIPIIITDNHENNHNIKFKDVEFSNAIIDTGASYSGIPNIIIHKLNLKSISKKKFSSPLDEKEMEIDLYNIWIGIIINKDLLKSIGNYLINKENYPDKEIIDNYKFSNHPDIIRWIPMKVMGLKNNNSLIGMDIIKQSHLTISNNVFIFSI